MRIIIENLSHSYGDKQVLSDINLTIESGESVGIAGVSGGGKSTLLKLVSGLYDVQHGCITIGGDSTSTGRRERVAMVMQNAMLFPASIRDNITCGHDLSEATIAHACDVAQLSGWISTLPDGLDTYVGERGSQVSGGQAQRIAIARAIAKDAPVILLDEPTSALDGGTGAAVIAALAGLTKGKTVIHVSHQTDMLMLGIAGMHGAPAAHGAPAVRGAIEAAGEVDVAGAACRAGASEGGSAATEGKAGSLIVVGGAHATVETIGGNGCVLRLEGGRLYV